MPRPELVEDWRCRLSASPPDHDLWWDVNVPIPILNKARRPSAPFPVVRASAASARERQSVTPCGRGASHFSQPSGHSLKRRYCVACVKNKLQ
ncbi:hypothetical protein E2C01_022093 [Portunus trituberculatus]|uniref:Uncharacterized protein n=1 Tax=Portunus trituberculatus TaxID=210409 RepID=A0A5B7E4H8_PORTR|nr:hypothetical protein [Portunus trituberculatus]